MRHKLLIAGLLLFAFSSSAQDFPGYRSGNYTGVNGVFFNPANIVDSRYRWDFNLVSVSSLVGNNQASFGIKNIGESFNGDSLINQFVGDGQGSSSGMVSTVIHGPSIMFNIDRKNAIAFSSRARIMMNAIDIDGPLADRLIDDVGDNINYPYTISSGNNMRVNVNAWSEFGLSYARVITDKQKHFLKGGITLKYLAGVANGYVGIDGLQGTLNEAPVTGDLLLSNASGRMQIGFGGVRMDDFDVDQLTSFQSTGFGADIGFIYEFRPDHAAYTYGEDDLVSRDRNKYKFRIGLALLDIGSIKYDRDMQRSGAYDIDVTGGEEVNLEELGDTELDDLKGYFDARPQYFSPVGANANTYTVGLPTSLQLDADYHLHRGFYLNLAGQFSLVNNDTKVYNSQYYSSIAFTPRYEGRAVGVYLPISYNELTKFNAGLSLRFGPLFFGSGSALTALMGDSKQADVHLGLRFGGLQKNKAKKVKSKK